MDLKRFECGNGNYKPKSATVREIEGVGYVHLVVDCPAKKRVPRNDDEPRSFFLWQPQRDQGWIPIPVSQLHRVQSLDFDTDVAVCSDDQEQNERLEDMMLMVDDAVVLLDA